MDPLSIAASVAGLVTLSGVIISKGFKISDRFNNSKKELDALLSEVSNFSGLPVGIQSHLQQDESSGRVAHGTSATSEKPASHERAEQPMETALKDCKVIMEEIRNLVEKLSKTPSFRLALSKDMLTHEAANLTAKLERYKSFFILSLQVNSRAQGEASREDTSLMKDQLEEIKSTQRRIEDKLEIEIKHKRKEEILDWLGAATIAAHSDVLESRHPQPENWFLSSPEYTSLISTDGPSFLWLDGIAGSGKTVLMSTAIDHIQDLAGNENGFSLAYHYCGFSGTYQDSLEKLLCRLLSQLFRQVKLQHFPSIFDKLGQLKAKPRHPSLKQIKEYFGMLSTHFSKIFLVIDGIDEFRHCNKLVDFIDDVISHGGNFKLLVSSRRQDDLTERLSRFCRVSMASDRIYDDIERYVRARVSELRWHDGPDIEKIIRILVEDADGMFLWVVCQLNHLSRIRTSITKEDLLSLPRGLGQTYETVLSQLSDVDKQLAVKILRFILFSERGLHLSEVVDAIAIETSHTNLQELRKKKLRNEDDVFEICGSLVRRSKATGHLMLAHHSIREFLVSPTLETGGQNPFFICSGESTTKLALSCLTYLNFSEFNTLDYVGNVTDTVLDELVAELIPKLVAENPFLGYAACSWAYHVSATPSEYLDQLIPLLEAFFDPNFGNLKFWSSFARYTYGNFWIPFDLTPLHVCSIVGTCSKVAQLACSMTNPKQQTSDGATALHLALDNGHTEMMKCLMILGVSLNTLDQLGQSPLHKAVESGNEGAMRLLLEAGADANTVSQDGATALSIAVDNNWTAVILEITKKSDALCTLPDGRTTLHLAAQSGDLKSAKYLLREYSWLLDKEDHNWWTALHFAAHYGHTRLVHLLLRAGATPNLDINGWSPAHSSIQQQDKYSLRSLLTCFWRDFDRPGTGHIPPWLDRSGGKRYGNTGTPIERVPPAAQTPTLPTSVPSRQTSTGHNFLLPTYGGSGQEYRNTGTRIRPRFLLLEELQPTIRSLLSLAISLEYIEGVSCLLECRPKQAILELDHLKHSILKSQNSKLFRILFLGASPGIRSSILPLVVEAGRGDIRSEALETANTPSTATLWSDLLQDAIQEGRHAVVNLLLGLWDPENRQSILNKHFIDFVTKHELRAARFTLEKGAQVSARDEEGQACFERAIYHSDILISLVENGINQSVRLEERAEARHILATMDLNRFEKNIAELMSLFQLLIEEGAGLQGLNSSGQSILHMAVKADNKQIAEYALKNGLLPDQADENNETPIDVALELRRAPFLDLLLQRLTDVDPIKAVDIVACSLTATTNATSSGLVEVLTKYATKALGSSNANALILKKSLSRALLLVTEEEYNSSTLLLLRAGADVKYRNEKGETALHLAARRANSAFTDLLLSHGADAHARTDAGITPLCLAIQRGSGRCVNLLLAKNAEIDEQAVLAAEDIARTNFSPGVKTMVRFLIDTLRPKDSDAAERLTAAKDIGNINDLVDALDNNLAHSAWSIIQENPTLVNTVSASGETVLHVAIQAKMSSLGLRIIKSELGRPLLNLKTPNGETALTFALMQRNLTLLYTLMDIDVDRAAALSWAKENKHELQHILESYHKST
ncbi:hypothetical protein FQN49_005808 [Arthroderma sp. PD_2]|nr:hypothetical protein FQN49_005808 [Arthroderma sp. PD_2]